MEQEPTERRFRLTRSTGRLSTGSSVPPMPHSSPVTGTSICAESKCVLP